MVDDAHPPDPSGVEEVRQRVHRGPSGPHDGVGDVERQRNFHPESGASSRGDAREGPFRPEVTSGAVTGNTRTPASKQRRAVMTNVARVPASASRRRAMARSSSWLSRTMRRSPPPSSKRAQLGDEAPPLARRTEADREHLPERAEVPGAHAEPVDPLFEAAREPLAERRGEERLPATPRPDESEARGSCRPDGSF